MRPAIFAALAGGLLVTNLLLAGCAGPSPSAEVRWAQAQSAFTEAVNQASNAREPCVLYGEDAPDCRIKADDYARVAALIRRGQAIIDGVGAATPAESTAETVLNIVVEIVAAIPVKR